MPDATKKVILCVIALDLHDTRAYYEGFIKDKDNVVNLPGLRLTESSKQLYYFMKNIEFDDDDLPHKGDRIYIDGTNHVVDVGISVYGLASKLGGNNQATKKSRILNVDHTFGGREKKLETLHYLATEMDWSVGLK